MKTRLWIAVGLALVATIAGAETPPKPKEHIFETKPLGVAISIKMVGPYSEAADLQMICLFEHKVSGDTYQGAAKETDAHLKGLLSNLRDNGDFVGELGETILITPPPGTIPAKKFMVIGLGEEKDVSLDSLRLVGRVAAREAVRLQAKRIAWAPVIRDQGNSSIDVGEGDRAFIEQMLLAYSVDKRLQAKGLAPKFSLQSLVIEAGPAYFDSVVQQVGDGISAFETGVRNRSDAAHTAGSR